ncbi:TIGR03790 family protein [Rhizobium sp. BE258]|uniref:TIGR03790 family protein n=1 Tax=Rhizobium sp. BE258 TaxID=2817722 RepID=UPI00286AEA2C|nr:TIGR03790 family protein [Rhizobium sp. BE258]
MTIARLDMIVGFKCVYGQKSRAFIFSLGVAALVVSTPCAAKAGRLNVVPLSSEEQAVFVPATLGVLTIANDEKSLELAKSYAALRGIPSRNIIELKLPRADYVTRFIFEREFSALRSNPAYRDLAGFALAFDRPYRVGSDQSITSALAQGTVIQEPKAACNPTPMNSDAGLGPGSVLASKPAMMLAAGTTPADNLALARRGKAADATDPNATILLVKTPDAARSQPREASMDAAAASWRDEINVRVDSADRIEPHDGLMGFQIGLPVLENLAALTFLPGAYADHLTSFGGALNEKKSQTVISELIRQGATASYGTVREPCNFAAKFPNPLALLGNYLHGDTLLEAYWKSVEMPTEGLLVGEPLARPFPVLNAEANGNVITIRANRHTKPFLDNGDNTAPGLTDRKREIRLYAVQSGTPIFLQELNLPEHLSDGDKLGDVYADSPVEASGLILGVLAR